MSKHKALELADCIEAGVPFDEGEIVEELRAQHALIVQMREALKDASDQTRHPDYDWPIWLSNQTDAAIAAADQYLGEQARAALAQQAVPEGFALVQVDALTRWRDAFAEELAAYDIDPPIHHVKTSHDEIAAVLAAAPEAIYPVVKESLTTEAAPQAEQAPAPAQAKEVRDLLAYLKRHAGGYVLPGWDGQKLAKLIEAVPCAAVGAEPTRSQRLAGAGYTRRPSWKSLPGAMDDDTGPVPAVATGWVSISDRLPPKFEEVLVAFDGIALASTGQYTGSAHDKHGWCYPTENNGTCDDGSDPVVTHWMPLPAAPDSNVPVADGKEQP